MKHKIENFGKNLKAIRKSQSVTTEALAKSSGISIWTIRNIENSTCRLPNLYTAVQLADALGVSIDELSGIETEREVI